MLIVFAVGALTLLFVFAAVARWLLRRAQDKLAGQLLEREGGAPIQLLTRADRVVSRYRRLPGLLGWTADALVFEGIFGEKESVAASRIQKIVTGRRLTSGRKLVRAEVLQVVCTDGGELEFVLSPASAFAWRSHLGLWAARERQADADRVTPGRS